MGWDLLEIMADTESELDRLIAREHERFWCVWIRDNVGQIAAVLYKPSGRMSPWDDPGLRG